MTLLSLRTALVLTCMSVFSSSTHGVIVHGPKTTIPEVEHLDPDFTLERTTIPLEMDAKKSDAEIANQVLGKIRAELERRSNLAITDADYLHVEIEKFMKSGKPKMTFRESGLDESLVMICLKRGADHAGQTTVHVEIQKRGGDPVAFFKNAAIIRSFFSAGGPI